MRVLRNRLRDRSELRSCHAAHQRTYLTFPTLIRKTKNRLSPVPLFFCVGPTNLIASALFSFQRTRPTAETLLGSSFRTPGRARKSSHAGYSIIPLCGSQAKPVVQCLRPDHLHSITRFGCLPFPQVCITCPGPSVLALVYGRRPLRKPLENAKSLMSDAQRPAFGTLLKRLSV